MGRIILQSRVSKKVLVEKNKTPKADKDSALGRDAKREGMSWRDRLRISISSWKPSRSSARLEEERRSPANAQAEMTRKTEENASVVAKTVAVLQEQNRKLQGKNSILTQQIQILQIDA